MYTTSTCNCRLRSDDRYVVPRHTRKHTDHVLHIWNVPLRDVTSKQFCKVKHKTYKTRWHVTRPILTELRLLLLLTARVCISGMHVFCSTSCFTSFVFCSACFYLASLSFWLLGFVVRQLLLGFLLRVIDFLLHLTFVWPSAHPIMIRIALAYSYIRDSHTVHNTHTHHTSDHIIHTLTITQAHDSHRIGPSYWIKLNPRETLRISLKNKNPIFLRLHDRYGVK